MKLHRILALTTRYLYLYKRSFPRILEIFYWPLLDLMVWGFLTIYLAQFREFLPRFVIFFLGALILWDILFRTQQGVSISFLEEIWSRNLLNLFVSPLTPAEFLISTMLVSFIKVTATSIISVILAWLFYSFNIFIIGISLIPFVINLIMMGWAIGVITTALILRYGQQAEVLAWGIAFLFQPISAVFYPVSVLPGFLQVIARYIPAAHVFEGMRTILTTHQFPLNELLWASGLNIIYMTVSICFFIYIFATAREKGLLLKIGE